MALPRFQSSRARPSSRRKPAAESLERQFSDAIINSLPGIFYIFDQEGRFLRWNKNFERVSGYSAAEIAKMRGPEFFPLEQRPFLSEKIQAAFVQEHGETGAEADFLCKDGRRVPHLFNGKRYVVEGRPCLIGMGIDITERKRAEEVMRMHRERMEMVTQFTEVGLWYCDLPFTKLIWSVKTKEHFGLPPDAEVTIDTFFERLHPEDRERTHAAIQHSIAQHEIYDIDYRTVGLDGRVRWIRAIGRAFYDAENQPTRFDGITVDITKHKQTEMALQSAKDATSRYAGELEKHVAERTKKLQESIQSLEGVLYHVAHDLRAPLRAMHGFTTILEEDYASQLDEEARNYTHRITHAAARMDKLIVDLLAYGRLAHMPLSLSLMDTESVITVVLKEMKNEIKSRRGEVKVHRPIPRVWADPAVFKEMLTQLLCNALTHVAPGVAPRVRIRAEPSRTAAVRIWVEDNGVGIAPEHHERIFRVFERLQFGGVYTGTGIGLALVRKGAERMGAQTGVESTPGAGSHFWVELPARAKIE